jgi:prepilin-type N-terminal cleavage/methylation domain-containing protein
MRPRRAQPRAAARRAAFTMIELMIVLVIIGIMVMTVGPSLQQVVGDQRQGSASSELIRIARRARGMALESGTAIMLWYREAEPASSNLGHIGLYVGMNSRCQQTPWDQAIAMPGQPVDTYDMTAFNPTNGATQPAASDAGRQVITLRVRTVDGVGNATDRSALRICFQPSGDVYTTPANTSTQLVKQRDRAQFSIQRTIDGVTYGRTRQVLFPIAGSMRFE